MLGGGLQRVKVAPEIDTLNFAPRMHVPTLMVNGQNDFQISARGRAAAAVPAAGAASPTRSVTHSSTADTCRTQIHDVMREMLDWFDKFLGPVNVSLATAEPN